MGLANNKKGLVFTILAIVMTVFFTTMFSSKIETPIDSKASLIEARVSLLDSYMNDFYSYAEGAGSVTGYAAIQGIIQDMSMTRSYKPGFEQEMANCTLLGNLTSTKLCPGMENLTLIKYLDTMKKLAEDFLNIKANYTVNNINITQGLDAFSVELLINITLEIIDDYANLTDTRVVVSPIIITGLPDPLFMLNGTYNQSILQNNLNKKEGDWNYTDLQNLYYNNTYRNYKQGISFIRRIKGDFADMTDYYGLESIVNYTRVSYHENHSMIDYLYWRNITFPCRSPTSPFPYLVGINGDILPMNGAQYFQLDDDHRLSFGINPGNTTRTCTP
ncbi:hypothetical protein JXB28_05835 [Candidatus Woesearchaeota archaeon]|nr:hypothetical protein [Candidatus Woesearchaeota archaeon]